MADRPLPNKVLQFDHTSSDAVATAPRHRRDEQSGFVSGVAASAPQNNGSGQPGSRRTPGTASTSSTQSSKRLRGLSAGAVSTPTPKIPIEGSGDKQVATIT